MKFIKKINPGTQLMLTGLLTWFAIESRAELPPPEIHGFASQAFLYSSGNNFYGDSRDGSWQYYEAGINANARPHNRLDVSGQLLVRDAGATDDGRLRTDYLFLDYRAMSRPGSIMGARVGRVRNQFGFYNASRDVLVTRPSILLPQSVYFEANGVRELLFSTDGAQAYSQWNHQDSHTEFTASVGKERSLPSNIVTNFAAAVPITGDIGEIDTRQKRFVSAHLSHEMQGGIWRVAVSAANTEIDFDAGFIDLTLDLDLYALSVKRNWERLTLTSEYALMEVEYQLPSSTSTTRVQGLYLQAEYRLASSLSFISRYDYNITSPEERSDSEDHNVMLGLRWKPDRHWVVDVNLHGIQGTFGIPGLDNTEPLSDNTELLAVMASFRF